MPRRDDSGKSAPRAGILRRVLVPVFRLLAVALALFAGPPARAADLPADLAAAAPEADPRVIALALQARACAGRQDSARLAVIDYSRPSTEPRLWVFDLATRQLLYAEHVAHGRGSGENLAQAFSNRDGSHQTSLGLFATAETYHGGNGYSLRMDGLEPGINDRARPRAIVMHGADYVDPDAARAQGRLGRSLGCPAVRRAVAREIIDTLKDGQLLFAWAADPDWQARSPVLACAERRLAARTAGAGAAAASP